MKKSLPYLFFLAGAILCTYVFQAVVFMWISLSRFTAADGPPGDIGLTEKLVYSIGFPMFYFIFLSVVFLMYRSFLKKYKFDLKMVTPVIFNSLLALYLICHIALVVFDLY
ncbi:hypothetical protein [Paenibacillus harenae]|uniref:hypothetical protein n=1 Tax=Paenibacillus harenae TaxID=306543 RepID=UPI000491FD4E|nr:hypothetical protein [Paenibacillus harenae]